MTTTKQAGTRVAYNPTLSATLTAAGPLAGIPSGWTAIANLMSVDDIVPAETNVFDDCSLEDTAPVLDVEYRPGTGSFTKKKNTQSGALFTLSAAATKVAFAYIYADGSAHVSGSCRIIVSSAAKATSGDFQHKVPESFKLVPDTVWVWQDHG